MTEAPMPPVQVLYEDNHLLAINKRSSDLVQGDKTGDEPLPELLKQYLKVRDHKPGNVFLGVIHRLDRPVSGVVLFAKTSKALARMNAQFQERSIEKTYWAVVQDLPSPLAGELVHFLRKDQAKNKSFARSTETPGYLRSVLEYRMLCSSDRYHLLEVKPHTGRHHQIRVQLSTIGCIIKGDLKYGARRSNPDGSIHLHARKLAFAHPVTGLPIEIVAPVPDEVLWQALASNITS